MDADLFQALLLGLVALAVILLLGVLATLSAIRKALEERGSTEAIVEPQAVAPVERAGSREPLTAAQPVPTAEPIASRGAYLSKEEMVAAGAGMETPSAVGDADRIRSVLEQHGGEAADAARGVTAGSAAASQPPAEEQEAVESAFAAHADDPQEEPFQRDGRWWFRRGDELLLYDEATGQWQPAPGPSSSFDVSPVSAGTASGFAQTSGANIGSTTADSGTSGAVASEGSPDPSAIGDTSSTFWKCPTCGAVNGSTAATCRMCFAARP